MKLLAVDLFCGLGGWTEGLLAEGYFCYDWIWLTRLVRSIRGSGRKSQRPMAAGCGQAVANRSATVNSWSKKASLLVWRIGSHTNLRSALSHQECKFSTDATIHRAFDLTICSLAHRRTTFRTAVVKADGNTSRATNQARKTQTQYSAINRLNQCWLKLTLAVGL